MKKVATNFEVFSTKLHKKLALACGMVVAATGTQIGLAQNEDPSALAIEEVIVTSRKRAESIQDVPIAVTSITSQLENPAIRNLRDIEGLAPNVQIRQSMGRTAGHAISIRGIGYSNDEKSFDPAVGVVYDGVALTTNSGALIDNFDIEAIEVMRGPQGTLFGKNTIAGVISLTRTDPTGELGGSISGTLGNFGRTDVKAVVNVPVIKDVLAAKFFAASLQDDGYIYNVTLDKDVSKQDYLNYGAKFLWTPSENFSAKLTVEKIDDQSDNGAFRNLTGLGGDRKIALQDGYSGGWQPYSPAIVALTSENATPWRVAAYNDNASYPDIRGDGCLLENDPGSTDSTTSASKENIGDMQTDAITLQMDYEFSNGSTATYIYGYRDTEEYAVWPYSGSACDFITVDNINENDQESHELRWATSSDNYDLVVGVYQMENSYSQDWFTYDFWELVRTPELLVSLYGATPEQVDRLGNDFGQNIYQSQDAKSQAVFGQFDYDITERLEISLGLRYSKDEKDFFARQFCIKADADRHLQNWDTCVHGAQYSDDEKTGNWDESWSKTTGKAGLSYRLTDDIMVYGSYATGFHSGGFYGKNQRLVDYAITYEPEEIESLEMGAKMDFLNNRVRLNVAAFSSNVEALQAITTLPADDGTAVSVPFNVGEVEYQGLEIEGQARITDAFTISGAIGILDAKYKSFDADLSSTQGGNPVDNSYLTPKQAPDLTLGVTASHTASAFGGLILTDLTYSWTDDFYTQEDNDPVSLVESYGKTNLSIAYDRDRYKIAAFVNNIEDNTNWVSRTTSTLITYGQQSKGRTYGVEVMVNF
ncbi:MAG: TonB-dependent receptor [Betaproteobacteria bacterium]|jgi:iron complex outermembrane receptor protein|nr:TonB-dependent receptor [Betaproteobacteria bacterium]